MICVHVRVPPACYRQAAGKSGRLARRLAANGGPSWALETVDASQVPLVQKALSIACNQRVSHLPHAFD